MMSHLPRTLLTAAAVLALAGCVAYPYRDEQPHHYSQDRYGNRLACYTSDLENQYDCFPVSRPYAASPAYDYDPFWPPFFWGPRVVVVQQPSAPPRRPR